MTNSARSGRREAVSELKRQLIIAAARRVFEAEGLEEASMRAIAREAGYTAGAIYFYFDNKETIYAHVLDESLGRLISYVERAAAAADGDPRLLLPAAALAFFDFYAENPRDLDLGFYLFRGGMRPQGLSPELDARLNARLSASLAPIETAAAGLGTDAASATAIVAGTFAHAVGLLLLEHTGRIRLFAARGRMLMEAYVDGVVARLAGDRGG
jgi:Transcriptional regulator